MSPKEEPKNKDAVITVNVEDFTRTRDAVILGLANLQSAVSELSRAYINHANTVLNRGTLNADTNLTNLASGLTTSLLEGGLLGGALPRTGSPAGGEPEKKKRKRAPHDPNAPKRALTPYFLYMHHNRSKIAADLGPDAKPKDVADEGTRRWAAMPESEKEVWKQMYADNLAVYKKKMAAYKAGQPIPEDDQKEAAKDLPQRGAEAGAEAAATSSESESDSDSDSKSEDETSSSESEKEPTPPPPSGKRRRTGPESKKEVTSPVATKRASPDKKKPSGPSGAPTPSGKPKGKEEGGRKPQQSASDSKRNKKKRKSEAGADE